LTNKKREKKMKTINIALSASLFFILLFLFLQSNSTQAQISAERTERTRLEQSAQTERASINAQTLVWVTTERENTLRLFIVACVLIFLLVAVATILVVSALVIHAKAGQQTIPSTKMLQMAKQGFQLEWDEEEGWIVLLPDGETYLTETDLERLGDLKVSLPKLLH
jgi:uncharacterized integral membrane protein